MLIGRKEEIARLENAYKSGKSEFVTIYGRRRIGKTYLVREVFKDKFTFQYTGIFNVKNSIQLKEFYYNLLSQGLDSSYLPPKDWFDAFRLLKQLIDDSDWKRKVIFLDELPWMDSRNSGFLSALENFWNGWASTRNDILLIICGSATSWIINKIFRNKGGLYNRVTTKILLKQFSLYECEELSTHLQLPFSRNMILEGYMTMGGIPYYWTKLSPDKSLGKNINDLFLKDDGELHDEFNYIYASMFNSPEKYIKVIEALSGKKSGLTRDEIIKKGRLESNGQLSKILEDLIECGFVRKYCHTGKRLRDAIYQLIDCYSLFYFQFVKYSSNVDEDYWLKMMNTPAYHTWCGLSFERVCLLHSRQIKAALGISGIMTNIFSWHIKKTDTHKGVQIDLLFDRADNIIDVCEMKYSPGGYLLSENSFNNLMDKIRVLRQYMPAKKFIEPVLITSNGIVRNRYAEEIRHLITSNQLFTP